MHSCIFFFPYVLLYKKNRNFCIKFLLGKKKKKNIVQTNPLQYFSSYITEKKKKKTNKNRDNNRQSRETILYRPEKRKTMLQHTQLFYELDMLRRFQTKWPQVAVIFFPSFFFFFLLFSTVRVTPKADQTISQTLMLLSIRFFPLYIFIYVCIQSFAQYYGI